MRSEFRTDAFYRYVECTYLNSLTFTISAMQLNRGYIKLNVEQINGLRENEQIVFTIVQLKFKTIAIKSNKIFIVKMSFSQNNCVK